MGRDHDVRLSRGRALPDGRAALRPRWLRRIARTFVALAAAAWLVFPTSVRSQPVLSATPPSIDFGNVVEMTSVPGKSVTITNISASDVEFPEVYYPPPNLDVWMDCVHLRPGESCTVAVSLRATALGPGVSSVEIGPYRLDPPLAFPLPSLAIDVRWSLVAGRIVVNAAELDFGMRPVGDASITHSVTLTNTGPIARDVAWRVSGTECATFDVTPPLCIAQQSSYRVADACPAELAAGAHCDLTVTFQPVAGGNLIAALSVDFAGTLPLVGGGLPVLQETLGTTLAVEYFNASLGHYFLSVTPSEMAVLDREGPAGWLRTGLSFWVYPADGSAPAGASPVCRYYGRPEAGLDSHFYSASADECRAVAERFPAAWILESPAYFYAYLPTSIGSCPADAVAQRAITRLYRAYNNRPDANHRFTTSGYLVGQMQSSRGWIPEGYGLDSIAMCLPP